MLDDHVVNVARCLPRSSTNGPGERFVLWVQGCPLHCPGCWNPDTWSPSPRELVRVTALADQICGAMPIDGVTFTGGEPFAQAEVLAELAERLRPHDLSLMAFTGYELEELTGHHQQRLLGLLDIVVTGRFIREMKADGLLWRGSSNQKVHLLSDRHRGLDMSAGDRPIAEIVITGTGTSVVTGFPDAGLLHELGTARKSQPEVL